VTHLRDLFARSSGPGAAHLGPGTGHAFRRGILREGENDGAGGAGGKPAGQPAPGAQGTPAPQQQQQAAPAQQPQQQPAQQQPQQQQAPKAPAAPAASSSTPAANDQQWPFECQDAIDTVVEETGVKLTAGAKRAIRTSYGQAQPQDGVAFVRDWITNIGLVAPSKSAAGGQSNTNNAGGAPAGEKAKGTGMPPPASNIGPPSGGQRDFESITHPNELTQDDRKRLEAQHGVVKANDMIRELAERAARNGAKVTLRQ
jgi:hypothetical protein